MVGIDAGCLSQLDKKESTPNEGVLSVTGAEKQNPLPGHDKGSGSIRDRPSMLGRSTVPTPFTSKVVENNGRGGFSGSPKRNGPTVAGQRRNAAAAHRLSPILHRSIFSCTRDRVARGRVFVK
jgi:hypothetical protein